LGREGGGLADPGLELRALDQRRVRADLRVGEAVPHPGETTDLLVQQSLEEG
jgi:hypothetical protein